ncbi:MAG: alcohol dehydrogenase catalytic domain-containing protein [Thermoleophilia bacterium]
MKGLIYNAPGDVRVETVPDPEIVTPTDAVVRVTKAGICGSDMHIYNHGDAFGFSPGCRLGHEFVGVVEAVGAEVRRVRPGDKVVSPFWFSCGHCAECHLGHFTSCASGGCYGFQAFWSAGGDVQGGQSELVRVPMADGSLDVVPEPLAGDEHDAKVLPVADVLGTAYHAVAGAGIRPGDTVMVVGDGAVGLLACHVAGLFGAANIVLAGHHADRMAVGEKLGATHVVDTKGEGGVEKAAQVVGELTEGLGPEVVIDAVSSADSIAQAVKDVRPFGTVSWVGMEVFLGAPQVPWDVAFLRNVTIKGGVAPTHAYAKDLWPLLARGRLDPSPVFTHDLPLDDAPEGYAAMATREEGTIKACVTP